jgi:MFS family permease
VGGLRLPAGGGGAASVLRPSDVLAGVRFLAADALARWLTVTVSVLNWAVSGAFVLLLTEHQVHADAASAGTLFAAAGAGNLMGSLLLPAATRRSSPRPAFLMAMGGVALCVAFLAADPSPWWRALMIGCCCTATPLLAVFVQRALVVITPADIAGRVQTAYQMLPQLLVALGPLNATSLRALLPDRGVVLFIGAVLAAWTAYGARSAAPHQLARLSPPSPSRTPRTAAGPVADPTHT